MPMITRITVMRKRRLRRNFHFSLFLSLEIVTNSPLCVNVLRFTWIFLNLFAQTADMYIYGAHVARVLIAPDNIQQVLSAVHLVRIEDEKLEHIELLRGLR